MEYATSSSTSEDSKKLLHNCHRRVREMEDPLEPHAVGLVHGRLKPDEKEAVMSRFRDGSIHAFVATSHRSRCRRPEREHHGRRNAERFGLAQLHQLRRPHGHEHKSYCVLLHDPKKPRATAKEKLLVLEKTSRRLRTPAPTCACAAPATSLHRPDRSPTAPPRRHLLRRRRNGTRPRIRLRRPGKRPAPTPRKIGLRDFVERLSAPSQQRQVDSSNTCQSVSVPLEDEMSLRKIIP